MAICKCKICGAIYYEEKEGKPIAELDCCPVCAHLKSYFEICEK